MWRTHCLRLVRSARVELTRPDRARSPGIAALVLLMISGRATPAQVARQRTYANPIDIDYRYNFEQKNQGISYRSGADPVILGQGVGYYLFETVGDGDWTYSDLGHWRHQLPTGWPLLDGVAPERLPVDDAISTLPSPTR